MDQSSVAQESVTTPNEQEQEDVLAERDRLKSQIERIQKLETSCQVAAQEVEGLKAELKSAREYYDERVKALRSEIRARDRVLPLFDQKPAAEGSQEEDDSWRLTTIEDAGIPEKLCALLRENRPPLETVGDIADWGDKHKKLLTDVEGIGPAKASQIETILDGFWETLSNTPEDEGEEDAQDDAGEEEDDE